MWCDEPVTILFSAVPDPWLVLLWWRAQNTIFSQNGWLAKQRNSKITVGTVKTNYRTSNSQARSVSVSTNYKVF